MSSKAVARRLRQASDLRDLSLSLMKAKRLHDEKLKDRAAEGGDGNTASSGQTEHYPDAGDNGG